MTQKATVNWNLSSMLLQYLGSYYPLGPRSLSPVLKMALISEDVFCGGKNPILLWKLFINFICLSVYLLNIIIFCVYIWGKMLYCKSLSEIRHYVPILSVVGFVVLMDSCIHSLMSHRCSDGPTARSNWLFLSHTHTVEGCARGAAEMSVSWLKLHALCRVISQSLTA